MPAFSRLLLLFVALLAAAPAVAQEPKGFAGVEVQDLTKPEADKLGWEAPRGAKVVKLQDGGPAARAGIAPNDVILSIDGQEIENMQAFVASVGGKAAGSQVRVRLLRAGRERTVTVTIGNQQAAAPGRKDGPILQLDTGGHSALIKDLAFLPDGKLLVSAGDDKVVRVWDWQAGKTVRTIRGQVGPGPEGKLYSMALSPDGRWLAVAGFLAQGFGVRDEAVGDVRLYEFATGKLAGILRAHTNVINALTFSPDSKRLISGGGLGDQSAIIWDVESGRLLHRLVGHKADIYAAAFTLDGARVATGAFDTLVKLWSVSDGKEIATLKGHKERVRAIAVSPVGGAIVSGSDDGELRLWDGRTGRFVRTIARQPSQIGALAFSPDGSRLISTCGYRHPCHEHVWDVASGKELATHKIDDNIVLAAAISPDGKLVATGGGNNHEIQLWDIQTGQTRKALVGTGKPRWAVGFSADGRRIAWGSTWRTHTSSGQNPLEFQLRLPISGGALGRPEALGEQAGKEFVTSRTAHGAYQLAHRVGGAHGYDAILDISRDGRTQASVERNSTDGFQHRSYTFTPDGQTVISGGDGGVLMAFDLKGQRLGEFLGHEGDVWAVTVSPDGRFLISGGNDHTVRLWNVKTYELIVTLFHGRDGEWVMWTPHGYYMGSPGSDKTVGWQVNKGPEQAADFVGAEQLRQHLNRPDIVERALVLASAEQAVQQAPGTTFTLADLLARPVPRFRILSPAGGAGVRGGRADVKIAVDTVPDPLKSIRVQVNGRQVDELVPPVGSGGFSAGERILDVPLGRGSNEVRITLTNAIGEKAETVSLVHDGEGELDKRGTLYILAVGVDKYPALGRTCGPAGNSSCDLNYSGADARRLVDAVEKQLGPGHTRVVKRMLVNGAGPNDTPTATNIIDAIDLLKEAKETDTVLLFIAGHGFNDGPNYRFLATNAERAGDGFRGATVVPWQILQEAVEAAKGRRILFIDTCHSGNAYNQRLGNAAYHANIIAYTAARFDQEAMEDPKLGHGLFTYAVVEALTGGGAAKRISTKDLAQYVVKRVDQLAKALQGEQEPQYYKGRDAEDYVLAQW